MKLKVIRSHGAKAVAQRSPGEHGWGVSFTQRRGLGTTTGYAWCETLAQVRRFVHGQFAR